MNYNPIILAADFSSIDECQKISATLKGQIGILKLGLEYFTNFGPTGIREASKMGIPIFLDLKLHDIPNTVAKATRAATKLSPHMLTIHTMGGFEMMKQAKEASLDEASKNGNTPPMILGVTILTSMDENDLISIGVSAKLQDQVLKLVELGIKAGIDGIVCSPLEIEAIKKSFGNQVKLIVPGIRPGIANDDQKRILAPRQALELGADYLVIGRPITGAPDPKQAASEILTSL